ncbi:hypothetical protein Tco_1194983 [Tanacetum coccineum]
MIAPDSSRYSSNDMVHNHYLEEAKKKTQEGSKEFRTWVMPSARSQSTTNGSKPKPRINNQKSRNWSASKSSRVTTKTVPIAEHSRNSRSFSDSKHFVCSTCTLNIHAGTSLSPTKEGLQVCLELGIPPADKTATSRQELELLFHHHITMLRSYALSWKPCQGDSLNLPNHRIHKDGDGDALFQLKSDSLPHAHAQTTKTYYKHQDSRIMKAQELKIKTSAQTLIYKIFLQRYQVYQGRLLASFQDDAKYEHVGQDTRSQGGKDDQDGRIKI